MKMLGITADRVNGKLAPRVTSDTPPLFHTVDNDPSHNTVVQRAINLAEDFDENPFGFDGGIDEP